MLAIFFPHMFEDIEYLLPPEEAGTQGVDCGNSGAVSQQSVGQGRVGVQENAVAGPSRLH